MLGRLRTFACCSLLLELVVRKQSWALFRWKHLKECPPPCLASMYGTPPMVASFPGRVGGEKTAWYSLLAHARAFPEKPGNSFSFVNGSKIDTYTSDSLPYHRKETSKKALSVRVRYLETCHTVRNLLHKCPEFRFDCLDFAYAGTAGKPSPLSTDTADMRSNLHRRERQSSHNPTSPKRAAEYLGRPSERRICFAATF